VRAAALCAVAILMLAAPAAPADEEPDWVFNVWVPSMTHFCWPPGDSATPESVEVPWEDVAYGVLEFHFWRLAAFASEEPLPCTLSFGGQQVEVLTSQTGECPNDPGCYMHDVSVTYTFTVLNPTSDQDFTVSIATAHCDLICSGEYCEPYGNFTGTLYLYAIPTAASGASWSAVKARY